MGREQYKRPWIPVVSSKVPRKTISFQLRSFPSCFSDPVISVSVYPILLQYDYKNRLQEIKTLSSDLNRKDNNALICLAPRHAIVLQPPGISPILQLLRRNVISATSGTKKQCSAVGRVSFRSAGFACPGFLLLQFKLDIYHYQLSLLLLKKYSFDVRCIFALLKCRAQSG